MDMISEWALAIEPLAEAYRWALRAAAAFLIGLAAMIVVVPARARAFLAGQGSTLFLNTFESALRLIAGVALIGFAARTGLPAWLTLAGLFLAVTAVAMLLLPGLHRRYAQWAVPFALKILPVYSAGAFALGIALLWLTALPDI